MSNDAEGAAGADDDGLPIGRRELLAGDYEFAYTVKGTREGRADKQVVREPSTDPSGQDRTPTPADD